MKIRALGALLLLGALLAALLGAPAAAQAPAPHSVMEIANFRSGTICHYDETVVIDVGWTCSYGGEAAFTADYRLVFSPATG